MLQGESQWDERPSGVYSMNDATPGDPYEEGWVDDLQDPRARHWRSENLVYDRDDDKNGILTALLGGGSGGSGGSGGGDGDNSGGAPGGSGAQPFPAALLMVYGILAAAAGYVWYSLSLAVNEPEIVVEKVDKVLGWGKDVLANSSWRPRRAQRQHSIEAHETEYRPLCVSTDGHLSSSRCVP